MTNHKPVKSDQYDQRWIRSAWGDRRNDELLTGSVIRPRPRLEKALEFAAIRPGQLVLDIACGRGELVAIANAAGAYGIGIDFSEASLEFATKLKQAQGAQQNGGSMEFVRADACRLPFASGTFDRITMLDIIEHLLPEQLEHMFREVHRLLKPDGFAVLHTLPNRWVYDITFPILHKISSRFPRDPRGEIEKKVHINEQDLPSLHGTLDKCGLKHRLWLEQLMPAQARWNVHDDCYGDNRDSIYPMLAGPIGRLLELAGATPAKLLLSNDIFGIVWKGKKPPRAKARFALTERLACLLPAGQ